MKKALILVFLVNIPLCAMSAVTSPLLSKNPVFKKINQDKAELGKKLFFDPRLSADGTISCNSCHNLMSNGSDHRSGSVGVNAQVGGRKSPTVWNAALMSAMFWDGRAKSLEEQAKGPLTNPIEMAMPSENAVEERVRSIPGYSPLFTKVFNDKKNPVTIDRIAEAIAEFERTLITPDSPFDLYLSGQTKAISEEAKKGYQLVQSIGCTTCHNGRNFAGPDLPQGTPFLMKFPMFPGTDYEKKYKLTEDTGRFSVTKEESDKNLWRVPGWRNVALMAPYFHNGSVKTLNEAVTVMAKTQLGKDLTKDQVSQIVSFLESLTGVRPELTLPRLPDLKEGTTLNWQVRNTQS